VNPEVTSIVSSRGGRSDYVLFDDEFGEPIFKPKHVAVRRRRKVIGSNPPKTAFAWTVLRGDDLNNVGKYRDGAIQTALPRSPLFMMAEPTENIL